MPIDLVQKDAKLASKYRELRILRCSSEKGKSLPSDACPRHILIPVSFDSEKALKCGSFDPRKPVHQGTTPHRNRLFRGNGADQAKLFMRKVCRHSRTIAKPS